MSTLRALFAATFAFALAACAEPREAALIRMQSVGPERLRRDAARLYKDVFAARSPEFVPVRITQWPASFRRLVPLHVGAYPDGFAIALEQDGDNESGLYVIPDSIDRLPSDTARAQFEPIEDGVFWYTFRQ